MPSGPFSTSTPVSQHVRAEPGTSIGSHCCQQDSRSNLSLSESGMGRTFRSMVVPTTGRSPTLAHMGGLSSLPSMAAAKGFFHTSLGTPICMDDDRSLESRHNLCGLKHPISRETEDRSKARHQQQGGECPLFKGSSRPCHYPGRPTLIAI